MDNANEVSKHSLRRASQLLICKNNSIELLYKKFIDLLLQCFNFSFTLLHFLKKSL